MDNLRLFLLFSLAAVLFLIYQAWIEDYGAIGMPSQRAAEIPSSASSPIPDSDVVPSVATPTIPPVTRVGQATATGGEAVGPTIHVETDLFNLDIALRGGFIVGARLKDYAVSPEAPDTQFTLLKQEPPNLFTAESGLRAGDTGPLPSDSRDVIFASDNESYLLEDGEDELVVSLIWDHPSGVEIIKRYHFERGSYVINSTQEVVNDSESPIATRSYTQLIRTELQDANASRFVYTYTGGVYYSPADKYEKVSFDDMRSESLRRDVTDGWIGMIQHYFMAAWIPPAGSPQTFFTAVRDDSRFTVGSYTSAVTVNAGASHEFEDRLFVGPKLQDTLASVAKGLDLAVDYGWLTVLAQPIFWLLSWIHALVGNWGWSIILLTILIKLAFYKLSETSYKSMANMKKMSPRLQALKDRYGDDKQRLNQAMMDLYKKEKINPLGGCLPIVVQIPVFIALYWVLLESVELRQAPFALWIDNLSAPDPFYVLPLVMGVSMFAQQKLNPAPPDPIQAKVMMSLPFVFTVFFAFFPAGLVLYWVANNLLSITQQWYITRNIEKASAKH